MKVAVVLTGQVRFIDWCFFWWEALAKASIHDVSFYSTTWPWQVNSQTFIRLLNRARYEKSKDINDFLKTDCKFSTTDPAELIKFYKRSKELDTYLTAPKDSAGYRPEECVTNFQYHFGRFYQFSKTITENDMSDFDAIVHSRWDCLVRDADHFDKMIETKGFVFDGVEYDSSADLYHTNDWIYKGDSKDIIDLHTLPSSLNDALQITKEYKNNDWVTGSKFIIGHFLYYNYIKYKSYKISNVTSDSTLFRHYHVPFKFNDSTWKKVQYCYYVDIGHIIDNHVLKNRYYRV